MTTQTTEKPATRYAAASADVARDALEAALRSLPALLVAYEATGDHDHGRGTLRPGAPCPGGDCLIDRVRRMLPAGSVAS